ncbi:hypothetical protein MKK69_25810 [Methylobacterium sp. J-026]|uniref:hypothetical protein n=1 Tax=Methylobacterium sp. J-026 TaxID=2836624 RepID=UPI001FBBD680|nr:hypothetical protein [Methylobacterium sp. J-026]MCJ2137417.1 hypothetical protein [Methylobacterium sp. J-026]
MTDRALANAVAKRDFASDEIESLTQRISALRQEVREAEAFISAWHQFAGVTPVETAFTRSEAAQHRAGSHSISADGLAQASPLRRTRVPGNPKKEEVARVAREIIEERGEPVLRSVLIQELANRGLSVRGADPEMVLSTMLWRVRDTSGLVRLPTGGYWVADRPHESSGYAPGNDAEVAKDEGAQSERPDDGDGAEDLAPDHNKKVPVTSLDRVIETPPVQPPHITYAGRRND